MVGVTDGRRRGDGSLLCLYKALRLEVAVDWITTVSGVLLLYYISCSRRPVLTGC